ncbi:hypothetical protein OROMI_018288 [Orobanche minor]
MRGINGDDGGFWWPVTGAEVQRDQLHFTTSRSRVQFRGTNFRPPKQLRVANAAINGNSSDSDATISFTQSSPPPPLGQSVEDLSKEPQVEHELMLVKLNSYSSTKDQSVSGHLHGKRHGHINKHFDDGVTGDPGKMAAVLRNLSKFGIKELARTGKIALRREKLGETAPYSDNYTHQG